MTEKANSREMIVETASRLFFCQGYAGTGLNQIIKESHSPKGSLYYYFPDGKEGLALECIHHNNQIVTGKIRESLKSTDNCAEAIQLFISNLIKDTEESEYKGFTPFSFWLAVETSSISEALREACQSVFAEWVSLFSEALIREGMESARAKDIGMLIVSMLEGALIIALTKRDKEPLMKASNYLYLLIRH
ncbi:TetR/AcrR family transcriptional regulator [Paenibacillus sp. CAA11]|uniref:TetR/AcrR family transcriptional regulator n=1 Tax=Paenibacillus sp. CAA11 TaxID=1532905 RepID=UPI000D389DB1|nr:TetR/AcrR family transcriptional regulator [Paenibacillus sp. CAA11]AWB43302.1 TetR/AcrR family transcriptional regulator [Paenibacillus sp. CAA11]